jgi:hypothetical protein
LRIVNIRRIWKVSGLFIRDNPYINGLNFQHGINHKPITGSVAAAA